jgi:hypothetical protein
MRHQSAKLITAAVLLVPAVAGCGGGSSDGANAKRFDGPKKDVANVADQLQSAARGGDAAKICKDLLTAALAQQIGARAGSSCESQVKSQLVSPKETITVRRLAVRGQIAVADVAEQNKNVSRLAFRKQDGEWRISGIA